MAAPLYGNHLLQDRANSLASYLNSGAKFLRLCKNNFAALPSSPVSAFSECNFPGYAPVALAGVFGAAAFVADGQYEIASPIFTFTCTGGPGQDIWGWYITDGSNLDAAQIFAAATHIISGGTFDFSLRPQEISQSIL